MQTLQYGNNSFELKNSRSVNSQIQNKNNNNYLIISPHTVTLHGMSLTSTFNIENIHQHLSVSFKIKSFIKGRQVPFVQIFPQKGSIMRGQVKKIRVKFLKQYQPKLIQNGSMMLRIYTNLNTEWNKQYMMTHKLRGWSQIKDLPIEQYDIPLYISDQYRELKQNIRESVVFESQFAKVSQDVSSLYGEQKFQVPQIGVYSRNYLQDKNMRIYNQNSGLYDSKRKYNAGPQRRSIGSFSQNKRQKQSHNNSRSKGVMKQVYFGNQPKIVQSKIEPNYHQTKRSKAESMSQKHQSPSKQINIGKTNIPKVSMGMNNPFSTQPLFQQFSDRKLPLKSNPKFQSSFDNNQDSQISILRSLQSRDSKVEKFDIEKQNLKDIYRNRGNDHNPYRRQNQQFQDRDEQQSAFKDFKTVDHHFDQTSKMKNAPSNRRSMEIIVLAIIAGFFVALGSNMAKLFMD